ncbi:MAG TPA: hypothetical protein VFZ11_08375 [Gemmatimonadaceae bacterium]
MRINDAYAAAGEVDPAPGSGPSEPGALEHLRWVVAAFETAQRERLRTEERIRSALRAGALSAGAAAYGLEHARARAEETRAQRLMRECIEAHPAWPWLAGVRGLGHTLAGRLLARLDVTRAPHPSSFWAYCGLSTVPGATWRCDVCGLSVERAVDRAGGGGHRGSDGVPCVGTLRPATGGGRVAQPRPRRGESSPYDREAKALCYLVGASFARQGGAYRDYLEEQMGRLQLERPDWPARRRQLTAQRKTVKLFLTHLWLVWRGALGLPLTRPHAPGDGQGAAPPSPWSMVEGAPRAGPPARRPHAPPLKR